MHDSNAAAGSDHLAMAVRLDPDRLRTFCRGWAISELSVFGSVLRPEDFTSDSDVDLLVSFQPGTRWSLLDHAVMEHQLADVVGRPVHLSTRRAVERSHNWLRRVEILRTARQVFSG